jgi:murein L,D-transpeptidase YcbB/YkuD
MIHVHRMAVIGCVLGLCLTPALQGQSETAAIRQAIGRELASRSPPATDGPAGGRSLAAWTSTRRFYADRGDRPAWIGSGGSLSGVRALTAALGRAGEQGLEPGDYPAATLRELLLTPPTDANGLAFLDVTATFAFFRFGDDLAQGRVAPARVDTMWSAAPRSLDLSTRLATALDSNRVAHLIEMLAPPQAGATQLRAALARYRAIAAGGGWPAVSGGSPLGPGSEGSRVETLRQRLAATADLAFPTGEVFDSTLQEAVERFQARHGLEADGIVGRATLAALNTPVGDRIRQLELNLERWRWLPRELGDRYVMVNSAAFSLEVVDSGCTSLVASVIAGRKDWPTPITTGVLTDVVFNPRWNIPRSIALREILPAARRDPGYLTREGIHVMDGATEVDPASIPWNALVDSAFSFRFWQEPGPRNPLGQIRFGVSNHFGVALHDTPNQSTFQLRNRMFSHGCIRVAGAADLAAYVSHGVPGWGAAAPDSVQAAVSGLVERRVDVPQPIPVYLCYWTAWMDADGTVEFRPDVYGWDAKLAQSLGRPARERTGTRASGTGH